MVSVQELDEWFNEHQEDLGAHKEEVKTAIGIIQNAIDMIGH